MINIIYAFFGTFGVVDALTKGGPGQATNILVYKVYNDGFRGQDLGGSSAQSVILMIVVIAAHRRAVPLHRAPGALLMVENRPFADLSSATSSLILGVVIIAFPVWMTFVASTHDQATMLRSPVPLLPGPHLVENYTQVLTEGFGRGSRARRSGMTLINSLIMALGVALGKIAISIISAFAIVYFRFPLRMTFFWVIFITLMLPVEVRIVPTYGVVANLGMLNSYSGLIIPLIASATATFLFRQFFLSVPDELDRGGAGRRRRADALLLGHPAADEPHHDRGPVRDPVHLRLEPVSLAAADHHQGELLHRGHDASRARPTSVDAAPSWNLLMAMAMLAMLPPVLVVVFMQRQFVRGLVETEK